MDTFGPTKSLKCDESHKDLTSLHLCAVVFHKSDTDNIVSNMSPFQQQLVIYGACEKNEWIFISINILKSLKSKNMKPEDVFLLPSCLKVQKYILLRRMWLLWQVKNTFPPYSVFVCFQQWLSSSRGQKSSMKSTQFTLHCIYMQPFPDKNDEFNLDVMICQAMIIFSSRYRELKRVMVSKGHYSALGSQHFIEFFVARPRSLL